ncbi:hypothetical protein SELMODRAFT_268784 [Selaginella moellendorffii]|uniref:Rab-GAP TBC domain-containing protein n=1 Tax=Selaginella moellendorffii TaxID=88036 RepID=D8SK83_SELML|nr:TBC1 domain family member 13 [Selaginella moellendorffii]XP_024544654.1 TBC1 domain family member 13 [Selaginella moellendorffii]EFJ15182.1 hypothetical protein SELMODRAFT_268784 [Selaginella moellendorffii]|eukprot:XP_002983686.1 TBC1 domain family member 13 [Selaginella moellendorffii]
MPAGESSVAKPTKRVPEWLNSPAWYTKPSHGFTPPPVEDVVQEKEAVATTPPAAQEEIEEDEIVEESATKDEPGFQENNDVSSSRFQERAFRRTLSLDARVGLFVVELSRTRIHLAELQRLASQGIPDVGGIRATSWKLLLGYLPRSRDGWDEEVSKKRAQYEAFKHEFLINPSEVTRRTAGDQSGSLSSNKGFLPRHDVSHGDHPLSVGSTSVWNQFFKDTELFEQIDRDVKRTHPDMQFFCGDNERAHENQEALKRALFIFAKLNPGIRYVQGMNEVMAPLYYVFRTDPDESNAVHAEPDAFFCFVDLLSDFRDHFCQQLDNSAVGIRSTISQLTNLLKMHDEELWRHLEQVSKVNPQFYAFRWITLLLTQEFDFADTLRLWDSLLSNPDGPLEILLRVCCAMLLSVRNRLLAGDFTSNLKLLQHFPRVDIHLLLKAAEELKSSQ